MNEITRNLCWLATTLCVYANSSFVAAATQPGFGALTSVAGLDLQHIETKKPDIRAWNTSNGSRVLFSPARELPMIDIQIQIAAGSSADGDTPGLAALTLYMLDEDSQSMKAQQLAEQLDSLGVEFDKAIHLDHAQLSIRSLSAPAQRDAAIDVMIEMLARPAFNEAQLAHLKSQLLALEKRQQKEPPAAIKSALYRYVFAGHPYVNFLHGTPEGVAAVTVSDLKSFHQRTYVARNLSLSIVGDLSQEDAHAIAEKISQALPQGNARAPLAAPLPIEPEILHLEHPGSGNKVMLALPVMVRQTDADYLPLMLAAEILGGGIDSRLMRELRLERGLSYGISASLITLQAGGMLRIEWDIDARYNDGSQDRVLATLSQLVEQGPTQAELDEARQQLAGRVLRQASQNGSMLDLLSGLNNENTPVDQYFDHLQNVGALTPADIRDALQRHLDLTRTVFISIGPSEAQVPLPERPSTTADQ